MCHLTVGDDNDDF